MFAEAGGGAFFGNTQDQIDIVDFASPPTIRKKERVMGEERKKPNPIDVHVGSRVRLRRTMLGLSQEKLGESLGITFQQIQKYEKGANRIGASRLQHIASVLSTPVSFFFEDAPGMDSSSEGSAGFSESESANFVVSFLSSPEGLRLNRAFIKIQNPLVRKRIVDLVKSLADEQEKN